MGSMAVTILVNIIGRDCLAPGSTALELLMFDVDASIDNIDIDTFTTIRVVNILGKSRKAELLSMADTRKTLA
jgi:hypothetical protein